MTCCDLCKNMLVKYLSYEPHDYQLNGVCPILVRLNLLAMMPTGSGKTGYFIMLMFVAHEISQESLESSDACHLPDKDP